MKKILFTLLGFVLFFSTNVYSQNESDFKTIDSIVEACYNTISGPKGEKRNWERFNSLFTEDAKLVAITKNQEGEFIKFSMKPSDYVNMVDSLLTSKGFYEQEISRKVEKFGHIAHVFSTYEGRFSLDDEEPFLRGINSFQLIFEKGKWRVLTILWQNETPDMPVPEKYLKD
jgi:hypothetical protein